MSNDGGKVYKVKDSVDLFLTDDTYLTAYYMNSRKRRTFRVNPETVGLLELIDGKITVERIRRVMSKSYGVDESSTNRTLDALHAARIITEVPSLRSVDTVDKDRFSRQINYFAEFFMDENEGYEAQHRLSSSKIAVFGCGAIGGNIVLELAMAGVRNLVLVDYDTVSSSDISRHLFFNRADIGTPKVESLRRRILEIDDRVAVEAINMSVRPTDDIEPLVSRCDFVVNTMDEPYIGYTSAKVSRLCVKHNKPHYIAGGFDAHLASTGELIIPHVTPCVECYANYFKESLKDWKPSKHPVEERAMEIGGLSSMSLFSASFAAIEIIKFLAGIVDMNASYKPRGEWLFEGMTLSYLDVSRDPACPVCGEGVVL